MGNAPDHMNFVVLCGSSVGRLSVSRAGVSKSYLGSIVYKGGQEQPLTNIVI